MRSALAIAAASLVVLCSNSRPALSWLVAAAPPPNIFTPQEILHFSPTPAGFGGFDVGTTSPNKQITITNAGNVPSTITALAFQAGGNPGDFAINTNNCLVTLAVNANCTFNLTFTPAAQGSRTATLQATTAPLPLTWTIGPTYGAQSPAGAVGRTTITNSTVATPGGFGALVQLSWCGSTTCNTSITNTITSVTDSASDTCTLVPGSYINFNMTGVTKFFDVSTYLCPTVSQNVLSFTATSSTNVFFFTETVTLLQNNLGTLSVDGSLAATGGAATAGTTMSVATAGTPANDDFIASIGAGNTVAPTAGACCTTVVDLTPLKILTEYQVKNTSATNSFTMTGGSTGAMNIVAIKN